MSIRTYKYKLYETKRLKHLHDVVNISGIIYNHCIALHKRYYKLYGKSLNKFQLQKHLTKLKKRSKYAFWNNVPSQAIQNITERIDPKSSEHTPVPQNCREEKALSLLIQF